MTTTMQEKEAKIDKRTKAYRDAEKVVKPPYENEGDTYTPPQADIAPGTVKDNAGAPVADTTNPFIPRSDLLDAELEARSASGPALTPEPITFSPETGLLVMVQELLILVKEIHEHIVKPLVVLEPDTGNITKLPPAPKPVGDLTKCMRCGTDLPETETVRTIQELCHDCIWRNA